MKFRLLFYLLTCLLSFSAVAQDLQLESLKKLSVDSLKTLAAKRKKVPLDTSLVDIYSVMSAKLLYVDNAEVKKTANLILHLSKKLNYERGIAAGKNDLALVLLTEGDANKAYQLLHSNINYYSGVKDYVGLGTNYLNLGIVHGTQNELEKAIASFNKALVFYKKGNAKKSKLASCYSMIGNAYSYLHDEEKSIQNYRKALKMEDDVEDRLNMQNNLGKAYADFKRYDSALYYYKEVMAQHEKNPSSYNQMQSFFNMGDLYLKMNQPQKAIGYLKHGLQLAEKEKHLESLVMLNKSLSEAYTRLGDFKNSLHYLKSYSALKDTVNQKSSIAAVKKIETQFALERQDVKLASLENQKKLNEAEIRKSNLIMTLGGIVLLLFVVLAWYWYRQHQTKTLLHQQQEVQFLTTLQLKEAESNLEGQLLERKRLAQELHDGLGATLAGIKLSAIGAATAHNEENKNLIASLDEACQEVRRISHHLIPPEFTKTPLAQIIQEMMAKYSGMPAHLHLDIHNGPALEHLDIQQKTHLYRILQESLHNAFKHAQCTDISVLITGFEDRVTLIVEDNGIGFDPTVNRSGIGLQNMQERTKALHSELTIDTSPGNGTVIQLNIPIHQA